jgi:site-specific DNA-cytosine methylase
MATNLTFGSLFAGVGGIDLGMEAAGWNCKWQVEWDPNCQETLKYHWPNIPKWLDVCDVNGAELRGRQAKRSHRRNSFKSFF